jgi:prepilin-type N-terminal cleavage/methylation domain-containing protein
MKIGWHKGMEGVSQVVSVQKMERSLSPHPGRLPWGEILRMKPSHFEPMNRMTCEIFSLAPPGGEGWGEGAIRSEVHGEGRDEGNCDVISPAACVRTPRSALRTPHSMGFTLIEIMLVVAILIIALAFSYPAISDMVHRAPMTQAVKDVMDACRHARSQAILTGQPMELRIYPQDMRIEVAQVPADAPPPNATPSSPASGAADGGEPPVKTYAPKGPYISSAQLSGELRIEMVDVNFTDYKDADLARVRFYPNGTCDEMTLVLHSDLEYRKISLEVVTSLVQVESDINNFTSD